MKIAGLAALCLLLAVLTIHAEQRSVDDFFTEFTDEWVRGNPDLATLSRYFTGSVQDGLERQLSPLTLDYKRSRIQLARKGIAELARYDASKLTEAQRVSLDLMVWQLRMVSDEDSFLDYTFPLEQMNGANVDLVDNLIVGHAVLTERDAENYVAALKQVSNRMDEAVSRSKRLAEKGILPPKFILQVTIDQMKDFIDPPQAENPFVTAFVQKMEAISALPAKKRDELRSQAEKIVINRIYPAWKKAIQQLQSQLPDSTDDAGLWRLKGGDAAYAYFLRRYTTTNLTPDAIHEIGLREVARIEREMDSILRKLGYTQGTLQERMDKVAATQDYPNPRSEESRSNIMRDINAILVDAETRSATLFDLRPKARVVAQPFPSFVEDNAAASYNSPAADGSRPGVFQYPRRLSNMTKFGLKSTVYHETIPGHHFQLALTVENKNLPRFRQIRAYGGISAYTEGWALYAERLAAESGWYDGDPEGLLGQLDNELFRARRLVVDTGLHSKHWTRQQAIDFGIEPSEVERYVVFPGQACSYMIGQLKIVELREKARKTLGAKFSLREFHNVVLGIGSVPLETLERHVNLWIGELSETPSVPAR
jgi:uncharacterized protein (DUF885 family)